MNKIIVSIFSLFLVMSITVAAPLQHLPMPPKFSHDTSSEKTLAAYPLGIITKLAAFAHHGQAVRTVTLPNGLEGWVYEVHTVGNPRTYIQPTGSETTINEIADHPAMATYTLVFDSNGTVSDVLYTAADGGETESALLIQRSNKGDKVRDTRVPGKGE